MSETLLELIVCVECKTRVEYHNDRDGYMSCECKIRERRDEEMPATWVEIQDLRINQCGGCRRDIPERLIYRCSDCDQPFHKECLDHHCKRGTQPQELRSENLFLRTQSEKAVTECKDWARMAGEEKHARLYYQGIVYAVCIWIDSFEEQKRGKVICGSWQTPSEGVEEALKRIGGQLRALRVIKGINDFTEAEEKELDSLRESMREVIGISQDILKYANVTGRCPERSDALNRMEIFLHNVREAK